MSEKLDKLLKNSREFYEGENTKFLDALADFIEANCISVTHETHYNFVLQCIPRGTDANLKAIYGYAFLLKEELNYQHNDVLITLSEETICNMLKAKYNANIQPTKNSWLFRVSLTFI